MHSTWITASAGTGKTHALIRRVLTLLLTGQRGILCLTFTKAAAHEMLDRIYSKVRGWVLLKDNDLQKELDSFIIVQNTQVMDYARSLFCKLPQLLTVRTIHAFCYELITQFHQEANIPYNTQILEYEEELYHEAINQFLIEEPDLGDLATDLNRKKLYELCKELIPKMNKSYNDSLQKLQEGLTNLQEVSTHEIANILSQGSKRDILHAGLLQNEKADKVFLNSDGHVKQLSSIITKNLLVKFPQAQNLILDAQKDYYAYWQQQNKLRVIIRTRSTLHIISQILVIYNRLKKNYVSYDDIIKSALQLLQNSQYHDWIMFCLSNKIEHILVDEAQDNSTEQWEIIRLLSADFFSGIGPNNTQRSIFVVGDVKQSIYGFQGAQPQLFVIMHEFFSHLAKNFNQEIAQLTLDVSYRSVKPILQLVDKMFNQQQLLHKISFFDQKIQHQCHRQHESGLVEVWPLIGKIKKDIAPWNPVHDNHEQDEKLILAQKIAHKISNWIQTERCLNDKKITTNDIIVLVRHRNIFIYHLITSLQKQNISVAGYDRFTITDHIFIKDLLSLGRVFLFPEDNLELINVLKSPLFSFTEEDIFKLCFNRNKKLIWERLAIYYPDVYKKINTWYTPNQNTFEIYYHIITHESFATEHTELIDKFLELAFEKPILSDFLYFMNNNKVEIRNNNKDGVRIMTVHSAKGLEAPIVFLADTTDIPCNKNYITFNEEGLPFYLQKDTFDQLKEKKAQDIYNEYIRLLYVALTRARDELYITGFGKEKEGSWYNIISKSEYNL